MALSILSHGGITAVGYDSATNERGFLLKITNRTGQVSVKGELVSPSTSADLEAIQQTNEYDAFGVIEEAGVAEGSQMWVWMIGSICQVLMKDTVAAVHGDFLIAADTNGRADCVANPGGGLPSTDTHFKECGHFLQSQGAGTNVLALAILHFN